MSYKVVCLLPALLGTLYFFVFYSFTCRNFRWTGKAWFLKQLIMANYISRTTELGCKDAVNRGKHIDKWLVHLLLIRVFLQSQII